MKKVPNYTVIKDTREKDGYFFKPYDRCDGMVVETMKTGDYTIKGCEDIICIERKASTAEIATNLGRKKKPFQNEMERMKDFRFSFLVCEFDMDDIINFPENSGIPKAQQSKVKVTGRYMLQSLLEFQMWYETKILFSGNKHNAFLVTNSIFKRINEMVHSEDQP